MARKIIKKKQDVTLDFIADYVKRQMSDEDYESWIKFTEETETKKEDSYLKKVNAIKKEFIHRFYPELEEKKQKPESKTPITDRFKRD